MSEVAAQRAHVSVARVALWRIRSGRLLTRRLVQAAAVAGLLASARFTFDPPRPPVAPPARVEHRDLGAEWLARDFTRRYLSFSAADPQAHARGLVGLLAGSADADAGLRPQTSAGQRVLWAEVAQERPGRPGERVFTVAAETDRMGEMYLSVAVVRGPDGRLAISRFPALVGAPLVAPADLGPGAGPAVTDGDLAAVAERALGNYLAGSRENLAADLAPGSRISPPPTPLALERVDELRAQPDGSVVATVQAHDAGGTNFTLAYELDVVRSAGRWEIAAIQADPTR